MYLPGTNRTSAGGPSIDNNEKAVLTGAGGLLELRIPHGPKADLSLAGGLYQLIPIALSSPFGTRYFWRPYRVLEAGISLP